MPVLVDTHIPHGNAVVHQIQETQGYIDVRFAPDAHGGPETLWFCFRIRRSGKAPPKMRLLLQNVPNILGARRNLQNLRPVIRTPEQDWQRIDAGRQSESPDGRVQLAWTLDTPRDWLDLAVCFPYGTAELQSLLAETGGVYQCDTIGTSQQGRPLLRLSNDYGSTDSARQRKGFFFMARQHSGETPGSWVLDGILRAFAAMTDPPLIWSIPLANIDGVEQGDYGKDNYPWDLNRAWGTPPMRYETLILQRDLIRWRERCRPMAAIDLHAPGLCEGEGAYIFYSTDSIRQALAPLAAAFAHHMGSLAADNFLRTTQYASRWQTPTFSQFAANELHVPVVPFEFPYAFFRNRLATRQVYQQVGRHIAEALQEMK